MRAWEWLVPFSGYAFELSRRAELLLAAAAIERGLTPGAREHADRLIAFDPFDESAWELIIRAWLAAGDGVSARRSYRKFSALLADELNRNRRGRSPNL